MLNNLRSLQTYERLAMEIIINALNSVKWFKDVEQENNLTKIIFQFHWCC